MINVEWTLFDRPDHWRSGWCFANAEEKFCGITWREYARYYGDVNPHVSRVWINNVLVYHCERGWLENVDTLCLARNGEQT